MSSMIQGMTAADFKSLSKPCRRIFLVLRERPRLVPFSWTVS